MPTAPDNARPDHDAPESGEAYACRQLRMIDAQIDRILVRTGEALGLFQALAEEDLTATELAHRTGTHVAYTRYWLQQQVAAGFVESVEDAEPPRYRLVRSLAEGLFAPVRPFASPLALTLC